MAQMTALRAHRRGGPEVLVVEQAPVPVAATGEVLVAVHAAAITSDELTWEETWVRDGVDRTPVIPSHEVSVVAAVGDGVTQFSTGDGVYGLIPFDRDGAAAEFVAVPASDLAARPTSASHVVRRGVATGRADRLAGPGRPRKSAARGEGSGARRRRRGGACSPSSWPTDSAPWGLPPCAAMSPSWCAGSALTT